MKQQGEIFVCLQGLGWLQYQIVRARMAGVPKQTQMVALNISRKQYKRELQEARTWVSFRLRSVLMDLKRVHLSLEACIRIKHEFETMAKVKNGYRT